MSVGPTQRLLQRARDWADDAEELAALQWQLWRLEVAELTAELRRGVLLLAAAVSILAIGFPLALIAGIATLAQAMEWPIAPSLAIAGIVLIVLATGLGFIARRALVRDSWFPRSRRQAAQNLRSLISSWSPMSRADEEADDDYFPD